VDIFNPDFNPKRTCACAEIIKRGKIKNRRKHFFISLIKTVYKKNPALYSRAGFVKYYFNEKA
jgi:hypothetical protein